MYLCGENGVQARFSCSSSRSTSTLKTKSRVGEMYQNTLDVLRLTPLLLSSGVNIFKAVTKYKPFVTTNSQASVSQYKLNQVFSVKYLHLAPSCTVYSTKKRTLYWFA